MIFLGTIVNALLIVAGTLAGRFLKNIPDNMKQTVMYGIGLAVTVMGIQMSFASEMFIIAIISIVLGAVIGELIDLEGKLHKLGAWIESLVKTKKSEGGIAQGFVTATLIFVIGSMAIIGSIDSGVRNDHGVLMTKGIIDGFTSIILSATLGVGVMLSAIPVFVYQGLITLFATQISAFVPDAALNFFIKEMTGTGGIMIMAIGLNMIGLTKIRVANLIPGIAVVAAIVAILYNVDLVAVPGK